MKALILALSVPLLAACAAGPSTTGTASPGAENCQNATHKLPYPATRSLRIQMCATPSGYTLSIDGAKVLETTPAQAEKIAAAYQDYKVTGGCTPQRSCTILVDGQPAASFAFK